MPSGRRTKATTEAEKAVTRRLVLERARVIVVPDGVDRTKRAEALKLLGVSQAEQGDEHAWIERGEHDGSQRTAIEAYAGKPGTSDAKVGTFKAVPVRNWKGGARYSQPALPKVERELLP